MWITAAVVQFFNSELLLVSFASSIGMVILYIVMENPEVNFNKKLNCFNSYALGKYLLDLYDHNTPFFVTSISFENEVEEGDEECIKQLIRVVHKNSHTYIFKELNMNFLLISKNEQEYKSVMKWIESEHTREDGTLKNILFICMDDGLKAGSPKHLSALLGYFRTKYRINDMSEIYCLNDELIQEFLVQEKMVDEIRKAIASDRVEVFFQPIYSTHVGGYTSAEALVRIRKEDGGLLSPGLFIPVAEKSGLIIELGEIIFEKTCRFLKENKPWEQGLEYVEINLSVLQCEQESLAGKLDAIMKSYDIAPNRINLEITETATLSAKKKLLKNMEQLMESGCTFSLDDFGKGESNLMYIVEMPVSIIKLDYDMTKAYTRSDKAKCVLRSVVNMAHDMSLSVVAEGIETKAELDSMVSEGIDYIQGYYFSKPLPEKAFMELISEYTGSINKN